MGRWSKLLLRCRLIVYDTSSLNSKSRIHLPTLFPPFSHPSRPALMKLTIASSCGARSDMWACTPSISLSRSAAFIIGLPSQPPRYAPSVMPSAQKPSGTAVPGWPNAVRVASLGGASERLQGGTARLNRRSAHEPRGPRCASKRGAPRAVGAPALPVCHDDEFGPRCRAHAGATAAGQLHEASRLDQHACRVAE